MCIYLQAAALSCSLYWKLADLPASPPITYAFFSFYSETNESDCDPGTKELSLPAVHSSGSSSLAAFPF